MRASQQTVLFERKSRGQSHEQSRLPAIEVLVQSVEKGPGLILVRYSNYKQLAKTTSNKIHLQIKKY